MNRMCVCFVVFIFTVCFASDILCAGNGAGRRVNKMWLETNRLLISDKHLFHKLHFKRVSMHFKNVDLNTIVQKLIEEIPEPHHYMVELSSDLKRPPITFGIKKAYLWDALQLLCEQQNIAIQQQGNKLMVLPTKPQSGANVIFISTFTYKAENGEFAPYPFPIFPENEGLFLIGTD